MNIFNLLKARRKRETIRGYITGLGPLLAQTFGKAEYYSPAQVREAIQANGIDSEEAVYAVVLYCTPEDFADDQAAHGGTAEYWPLRVEITEYNFRHRRKRGWGDTGEALSSADQDALSG